MISSDADSDTSRRTQRRARGSFRGKRSGSSSSGSAPDRKRQCSGGGNIKRQRSGSASSEAEPFQGGTELDTLFAHGCASLLGKRPAQEDEAVVVQLRRGRLLTAFAAVLDGHGGSTCARKAAASLTTKFQTRCCTMDPSAFLAGSVKEIDEDLLSSGSIADICGTTLTCVLAQQHRRPAFRLEVCVGNLGDSRVLKVRLGRNAGLCEETGTDGGVTVDHKPSLHEEKRRIEACGSVVVTAPFNVPRINGELALSRGLGDRRWKMAKNEAGETPVSAVPDVFRTHCRRNEILVLISDGLVEAEVASGFGNREVAAEIAMCLAQDPGDLAGAAERVCKRAEEAGSNDNLTCLILKPRFAPAEVRRRRCTR